MSQVSLPTDGIAMRGDLCILVRDAKTQQIRQRIEIRNKITFLAADVLVELLAQRVTGDATPAANRIFSMRMGTSNAPASRSDINLGAMVIGKALADINKTTGLPGELQFTTTLESGDANGSVLQEAGLFTAGAAGSPSPTDAPGTLISTPRMFARQIYPAQTKTSSIALEYSWRIAFTA